VGEVNVAGTGQPGGVPGSATYRWRPD